MIRRLLARLVGGGSGKGHGQKGGDDSGDDGSGFLPSRLDASVLYAHGMGKGGAEREIANVGEKAKILEAEQRRDE